MPDVKPEVVEMPHFLPRTKKIGDSLNDIPLVIYETWHTNQISKAMRENIEKLRTMNPEFDFYFYTDEDCANFIRENFEPAVLQAWDALIPGAFKSDLWRYCILYKKGGVYLDVKYYSVEPILPVVKAEGTTYVKDWKLSGCSWGIYNGFMISAPNNEIFRKCIDDIVDAHRTRSLRANNLDVTGPCLLGRILRAHRGDMYIQSLPLTYAPFPVYTPHGIIRYKGQTLLLHYPTYRQDQRMLHPQKHYSQLYDKERRVWR